jgi:acyl-CoA thioester hydrolase/1,4-dihydroxy-2-naphthoyl-CoA hydrolase
MKFTYKQRINFYDCDPAGIMFYGNAYRLCHSAYEKMIEEAVPEENYWNNSVYFVPIIKSEASYHKPFLSGETAVVELQVTVLKSSSFELTYTCLNNMGEICINVKTVHVFVDKKSNQKIAIPGNISSALKNFTAY